MTKEQRWISNNLGRLVKRYAGKYVAVVGSKVVASGKSAQKIEEFAKKHFKVDIPSIILVPHKKDLVHVLCRI